MIINYFYKKPNICLVLLLSCILCVYGCGRDKGTAPSLSVEIFKSLNQLEKKIDTASKNRTDKLKFEKELDRVASYGQKAIPSLSEEFKKSKLPTRRLIVVWILAKIGGNDAETMLTESIGDPSAKVRAAIAFALGEFDTEKSLKALSYLLVYDNSPDVRQLAILSLGRLGNEKALEVVKTMLNDKNPTIRQAAQEAINRFNENKKSKN